MSDALREEFEQRMSAKGWSMEKREDGRYSDPYAEMRWQGQEAARASAPAAPPAPSEVPSGWKVVPVEPTDDMVKAGYLNKHRDAYDPEADIYRAMLAAAPSANQGVSEPLVHSPALAGERTTLAGVAVGCSQEDVMRQALEATRKALDDAWNCMDLARNILTDGNPRKECNWGMLDTTYGREALRASLPSTDGERK